MYTDSSICVWNLGSRPDVRKDECKSLKMYETPIIFKITFILIICKNILLEKTKV